MWLLKNLTIKQIVLTGLLALGLLVLALLLKWLAGDLWLPVTLAVMLGLVVALQFMLTREIRWQANELRLAVYHQIQAQMSVFAAVRPRLPLPPMNEWALSPHTAVQIITQVTVHRPRKVLEFGSGVSTVILGYLLQAQGGTGRVLSLDHEREFADITAANLQHHGVDAIAEVAYAPFTGVDWYRGRTEWYDLAQVESLEAFAEGGIDLVIVDGPPGGERRYLAVPGVFDKVRVGGLFIFDDFDTAPIKAAVTRAMKDFPLEMVAVGVEEQCAVLRKTSP